MRITLYHVTPKGNENGILLDGVLPSKSRGLREWSYWVEEERLTWALAHVSLREEVAVSKLVIFVATVDGEDLIKTHLRGVWAIAVRVEPTKVFRPGSASIEE